jgi:hypothetical protein
MSPSHASGEGAGPATGVMVLPQASRTVGGVGGDASAAQLTIDDWSAGITKSGMSIV